MQLSLPIRLLICMLLCLQFASCSDDDNGTSQNEVATAKTEVKLMFYQNDTETQAEFETGLMWAFSFLGARLEEGSWSAAVSWESPNRLQLNVSELGFNKNAQSQLERLIQQFKASEEYHVTGGIDAGRFVVCILNNPNHYYKIVGMPTRLSEYVSTFSFQQKRAAILESAVAYKERLIQMPKDASPISRLAFFAEELSGSLVDSSHDVVENEVMDIMENGQLRFGVYDTLDRLIEGSDPVLSMAGKPVKCLWCHETAIQPAFAALTSIPGYYSPAQFDSLVAENTKKLVAFRASLNTENDMKDASNHTKLEKLYFRYMEPSAKRLASEWGLTIQEVEHLLQDNSTHQHHEFPAFGQLYFRNEIEVYAPYASLPSSSSTRETNPNEPNLLP